MRSSMFLLRGVFELGGCNYAGREKGRNGEGGGEDHENGSGGRVHTSAELITSF